MTVAPSPPFPVDALLGCERALVLFAAGFLGKQDAAWIADAGMRATCVDSDNDKLTEMELQYPGDWEFIPMDAYEFAALSRRHWDVVTLDPWTQDFTRCAENLPAWCRLARHAVILGTGTETIVRAPDGWEVSQVVRRSDYAGGVFWTLLERM